MKRGFSGSIGVNVCLDVVHRQSSMEKQRPRSELQMDVEAIRLICELVELGAKLSQQPV